MQWCFLWRLRKQLSSRKHVNVCRQHRVGILNSSTFWKNLQSIWFCLKNRVQNAQKINLLTVQFVQTIQQLSVPKTKQTLFLRTIFEKRLVKALPFYQGSNHMCISRFWISTKFINVDFSTFETFYCMSFCYCISQNKQDYNH